MNYQTKDPLLSSLFSFSFFKICKAVTESVNLVDSFPIWLIFMDVRNYLKEQNLFINNLTNAKKYKVRLKL